MNPYTFSFPGSYYGVEPYAVYYDPNNLYPFMGYPAGSGAPLDVKAEEKRTDYPELDEPAPIEPEKAPQPQNAPREDLFSVYSLQNLPQHNTKPLPNPEKSAKSAKRVKSTPPPSSQKSRDHFKNFESNVVNKVFTFLWTREKSGEVVGRILGDRAKVGIFYEFMKIIKKFSKRYITKEYLANLSHFQPHHIAYKIVAKKAELLEYFPFEEFSRTVRILIAHFLRSEVTLSILTSKKMRCQFWEAHLDRARSLLEVIFGRIDGEEYWERCQSMFQKMSERGITYP